MSPFRIQVSVDVPDVKGREEILKVHARNKKLLPDVELEQVRHGNESLQGEALGSAFGPRRHKLGSAFGQHVCG